MNEKETKAPWLSLVGIGADGLDGLGRSARAAVAGADIIIGGQRHLAFLPEEGPPGSGPTEKIAWPSPLQDLIEKLPEYRGKKLCLLATGDPFFFGIGNRLAEKIPIEEMQVYPAPSSFSLALARLGWPHSDTGVVSLHGRPLRSLLPRLVDKARLVMLTENRNSPGEIAALLVEEGFGDSILHVFSHLGGPEESHISLSARELAAVPASDEIQDLNILAAELQGDASGLQSHLLPGIEDDRFRHDGQLTKRETRILTLAALMPRPGDLLWDVGAGAGSISIEWLRADPSLEAIAIEKYEKRMDNLRANAEALGTPRLQAILGDAPACLTPLPDPDAVFIGGGLRNPEMLETCWARLKPGGRLVANVVTLEGEGALQAFFAQNGGHLTRLQVSHVHQTGRLHGWRPGTPVTQLRITKTKESG